MFKQGSIASPSPPPTPPTTTTTTTTTATATTATTTDPVTKEGGRNEKFTLINMVNKITRRLSTPLSPPGTGRPTVITTCSAPTLRSYMQSRQHSSTSSEESCVEERGAREHDKHKRSFTSPACFHDEEEEENMRLVKFGKLLSGPTTDLCQLRKHSWNGIPNELRGKTWRLLSGYLPVSIDRRQSTLQQKRSQYHSFVNQYYPARFEAIHEETFRQIHVDIPRTNPLIPFFQQDVVQQLFERILFIWAIRHPASGYVQGINDLVVPFFMVFLSEFIDTEVENYDISEVPKLFLDIIEADTFWCFSKLLDGIQNNYTFAQPGIQMKVNKLKELMSRIDEALHSHLDKHRIDYLFFAFRWMNNLLMRELPLNACIRLWDTYWAEVDGFALFHLYVCAALLKRFSAEILQQTDFQSLMTFLQNLPCSKFTNDDVSTLLSEAYQLKFMFADAPGHLSPKK